MQGIVGADLGQFGLAKDVTWKFKVGSHADKSSWFAKSGSSLVIFSSVGYKADGWLQGKCENFFKKVSNKLSKCH